MPQLNFEPWWVVKLRGRELALVRAALGGRLKPEQRAEAEALDQELGRQVTAHTKSTLRSVEKLSKSLGEET